METNDNQYDFITDSSPGGLKKVKNPLPFGGGGGKNAKMKLVLIAGGALALVLLGALVFSFLANRGPDNKQQLLKVAQQQNELIRISDLAIKEARGTQARNLAMTTKLSLRSDQSSLTSALKAQKVKVGSKELKAGQNKETDAKMTEAMQNNRFDEVYLEFIQEALVNYQKDLNTAYKTTESAKLKETIKIQYQNASIIIGVDPEV